MPSRYRLKKAAGHVDYEVWMLGKAAETLSRGAGPDEIAARALLEAWCLHLRNLVEFFHPKRSDVVKAEDFVRDANAWRSALPPLSARDKRRQKALHTLLAHLTYERYVRSSNWSARDQEAVLRRLRLFLRHLSDARRKWFPRTSELVG